MKRMSSIVVSHGQRDTPMLMQATNVSSGKPGTGYRPKTNTRNEVTAIKLGLRASATQGNSTCPCFFGFETKDVAATPTNFQSPVGDLAAQPTGCRYQILYPR